jgi:glycosyltransferase involved in cell wall biosynthesis
MCCSLDEPIAAHAFPAAFGDLQRMSAALEPAETRDIPSLPHLVTVVLAGNHPADRLLSMERYARMLHEGLKSRGIKTVLTVPEAWLSSLPGLPASVAKMARYFDKYVIFPLLLRWRLRRMGPVIVHVTDQGNGLYLPWLCGFPRVVTNHDLLAIRAALGEFEDQQPMTGRGRGWGQRAIRHSLRQADTVACVSSKSLEDGRRLLAPAVQDFFLVPNAVEPQYFCEVPPPPPADLPQRYLLHVGGSTWYKNRAGALRIHGAMRQQSPGCPSLVLIGDALSEAESRVVSELGLAEQFILRVRPPDLYVQAAYAGAEALIFPSLEEGFGWPVLEAMAAGCPVFTSNRPPLTEVGGSVAEYFDPENPATAAEEILRCLALGEAWRKTKAEAGKKWAATFTCTRFIDAMMEVYAATLNRYAVQAR